MISAPTIRNRIEAVSNFKWIFLILLLACFACWPALTNGFVNWDDHILILKNPLIRDLSWQGIQQNFEVLHINGAYHPLTNLSWALDHAIWEFNPVGFHLTNVLWHLLNVVLVYLFFLRLTARKDWAILIALLMAIHPMHAEAVAWVSARKDLVYSAFFLGAMLAYLRFSKVPQFSFGLYLVTVLCFLLALLGKGMAITLPAVLLLIDFWHARKFNLRLVLEKIPFFILAAIFGYIGVVAQNAGGALDDVAVVSLSENIFSGFYSIAEYAVKAIVPAHLAAFHPYPMALGAPVPWYFYSAAVGVVAVVIFLFIRRKQQRKIAFGIGFFLVCILPVAKFVPLASFLTAERFTYLPYLGLFLVMAIALDVLLKLVEQKRPSRAVFIYGIPTVFVLILGVLNFQRMRVWENGKVLWENQIAQYPNDELGYMNLADYLKNTGDEIGALVAYDKAAIVRPNAYKIYCDRGRLHEKMGHDSLAMQDFNQGLQIQEFAATYLNRGILHAKYNALDLALKDLDAAIRLDAEKPVYYHNRGLILKKMGKVDAALEDFAKLEAMAPRFPNLDQNKGQIHYLQGRLEAAKLDFENCLQAEPNNAQCWYGKGALLLAKQQFEIAEADFEKALSLDSSLTDAWLNRGVARMNQGNFEAAFKDFDQAQALSPQFVLIYINRVALLRHLGREEAAIAAIEEGLLNLPNHPKLLALLSKP